jgi:hypothetical protein
VRFTGRLEHPLTAEPLSVKDIVPPSTTGDTVAVNDTD